MPFEDPSHWTLSISKDEDTISFALHWNDNDRPSSTMTFTRGSKEYSQIQEFFNADNNHKV